jgi:hypothetical protein
LENPTKKRLGDPGIQTIVTALEHHLAALDSFGAHIAAAHVDAAIQQLRADLARQSLD